MLRGAVFSACPLTHKSFLSLHKCDSFIYHSANRKTGRWKCVHARHKNTNTHYRTTANAFHICPCAQSTPHPEAVNYFSQKKALRSCRTRSAQPESPDQQHFLNNKCLYTNCSVLITCPGPDPGEPVRCDQDYGRSGLAMGICIFPFAGSQMVLPSAWSDPIRSDITIKTDQKPDY